MNEDLFKNIDAEKFLETIRNPNKNTNNKTAAVILHDCEEKEFPAEKNVLRMAISGNQVHFNICKEQDINGSFTYTTVNELAFDLNTFINAFNFITDDLENEE